MANDYEVEELDILDQDNRVWLVNNQAETIRQAAKLYGKEHQKVVAIEELSELQKEICKDLRGIGDRKHIVEEIADVEIMLTQLKEFYEVKGAELRSAKCGKLRRLKSRILEKLRKKMGATNG